MSCELTLRPVYQRGEGKNGLCVISLAMIRLAIGRHDRTKCIKKEKRRGPRTEPRVTPVESFLHARLEAKQSRADPQTPKVIREDSGRQTGSGHQPCQK